MPVHPPGITNVLSLLPYSSSIKSTISYFLWTVQLSHIKYGIAFILVFTLVNMWLIFCKVLYQKLNWYTGTCYLDLNIYKEKQIISKNKNIGI